jgi:hypothetical protein
VPTKPIERLLFAQGGQCFFCEKSLPRSEASVEHIVAVTHGGKDNDENCVACCKSLNGLFGRMSLKEKLQILLRQKGDFVCPAGVGGSADSPAPAVKKSAPAKKAAAKKAAAKKIAPKKAASKVAPAKKVAKPKPRTKADKVALIVTALQKRGDAKPSTLEKLENTIRAQMVQLGEPENEAPALLRELSALSYITATENKVTYALPSKKS